MTTPILSVFDDNWVNHCLMLIIEREAREVAEQQERELKKAMALLPEIEPD